MLSKRAFAKLNANFWVRGDPPIEKLQAPAKRSAETGLRRPRYSKESLISRSASSERVTTISSEGACAPGPQQAAGRSWRLSEDRPKAMRALHQGPPVSIRVFPRPPLAARA